MQTIFTCKLNSFERDTAQVVKFRVFDFKVKDIAAKDCILFLWTTGAQMKNSIELMNAWGFAHKTMFMTWIKTTKGEVKANRLGFYTRQSCEYVLMGSRGAVLKYKNPEFPNAVCNVFDENSQEHSRKPTYVRELIDQMFLNVPKIELFAREQTNGEDWDYWGNEVDKFEDNEESTESDQNNREETRILQIQLSEQISLQKRSSSKQLMKMDNNSDEEFEEQDRMLVNSQE